MFQEYPKMVYPEGGDPVVVQDAEQEAAVMGKPAPQPEPVKRGPGRPRKVAD